MTRITKVTPKGTAVFPRLDSPDTRFDADGVYQTKLRLSSEKGQPMADEILQAMEAALKEAITENSAKPKLKQVNKTKLKLADPPFSQDDETGDYLFNFKMKAKVTSKKDNKTYSFKPVIVDAKGQPVIGEARIGAGSIIKVAYEMGTFFTSLVGAGVSLRLRGVQVLEYVEYTGGASAESLGFAEEEGGWTAPKKAAVKEADADNDADEDTKVKTDEEGDNDF